MGRTKANKKFIEIMIAVLIMLIMSAVLCVAKDEKEPAIKPYPEYKTIEEIFGKDKVQDFKEGRINPLEMPKSGIYIYQNSDEDLMYASLKYKEILYNVDKLKERKPKTDSDFEKLEQHLIKLGNLIIETNKYFFEKYPALKNQKQSLNPMEELFLTSITRHNRSFCTDTSPLFEKINERKKRIIEEKLKPKKIVKGFDT